jgi:hypothetical protein
MPLKSRSDGDNFCKMPLAARPHAGLHLYATAWADFLLEAGTIIISLILYARSPDLRRPARAGLLTMDALMLTLQAVWNFGLGSN